jgi:site-specific recombinase XerD
LKPEDLATHKGCSCVWWVSGTNDFGVTIPRQSTKARTWGAACQALQKFNVPNKGAFDHRVTLVSGFEVWMEQEVNQLAESTRELYSYSVKQLLAFLDARGVRRFDEITPDHIFQFISQLRAEGLKRGTINLKRGHLNIFFKYAFTREWIESNPVAKVRSERKKLDEAEEPTLPLDEEGDATWRRVQSEFSYFLEETAPYLSAGFSRLPAENFQRLIELMYYTGLRVSDAVMFDVRKIVDTAHGGSYTTRQIKLRRSSPRAEVTVFLEPWLKHALRALTPLHEGYLFFDGSSENLKHYIQRRVRRPLRHFGLFLGLPQTLRPHRFRDSFAVNRINDGVLLQDLATLLGHTSVITTEKHYMPWVKSRQIALEKRLYATKKVVEIQAIAS